MLVDWWPASHRYQRIHWEPATELSWLHSCQLFWQIQFLWAHEESPLSTQVIHIVCLILNKHELALLMQSQAVQPLAEANSNRELHPICWTLTHYRYSLELQLQQRVIQQFIVKTLLSCSQTWLRSEDILGIMYFFKTLQNLAFLPHLRPRKSTALNSCLATGWTSELQWEKDGSVQKRQEIQRRET